MIESLEKSGNNSVSPDLLRHYFYRATVSSSNFQFPAVYSYIACFTLRNKFFNWEIRRL